MNWRHMGWLSMPWVELMDLCGHCMLKSDVSRLLRFHCDPPKRPRGSHRGRYPQRCAEAAPRLASADQSRAGCLYNERRCDAFHHSIVGG